MMRIPKMLLTALFTMFVTLIFNSAFALSEPWCGYSPTNNITKEPTTQSGWQSMQAALVKAGNDCKSSNFSYVSPQFLEASKGCNYAEQNFNAVDVQPSNMTPGQAAQFAANKTRNAAKLVNAKNSCLRYYGYTRERSNPFSAQGKAPRKSM